MMAALTTRTMYKNPHNSVYIRKIPNRYSLVNSYTDLLLPRVFSRNRQTYYISNVRLGYVVSMDVVRGAKRETLVK